MKRKILVVDVGGTHVKLLMSPGTNAKFHQGREWGRNSSVARFKESVRGWKFDARPLVFRRRYARDESQEIQST